MSNLFESLGRILDGTLDVVDAMEKRERKEVIVVEERRPRPIYVLTEDTHVHQVAVYRGISTLGRPKKVLEVRGTVTWKKFRLTATDDGVLVQWFGTLGPERQYIDCGENYTPFGQGYCFAVL